MAGEEKELEAVTEERVKRGRPSPEEALRRMAEFEGRKERFVAAVRKSPD